MATVTKVVDTLAGLTNIPGPENIKKIERKISLRIGEARKLLTKRVKELFRRFSKGLRLRRRQQRLAALEEQ